MIFTSPVLGACLGSLYAVFTPAKDEPRITIAFMVRGGFEFNAADLEDSKTRPGMA